MVLTVSQRKLNIDSITKLQEKFKGKVSIAGINSNDPDYPGEGFENMKRFATESGINFPYLKGEKIEKGFEPSMGCSIKWK